MRIPLGTTDYDRPIAETPELALRNRFFETDPSNQEDQVALLTRPGLRKLTTVGDGPIRGIYSQPGSFGEALFVVSGNELWRVDPDLTKTNIGTIGTSTGGVSMTATAYPFSLFLADGHALWLMQDKAQAEGTLTASGAIANNDVVKVDSTYYKWTSGSVDSGTPAGTVGDPWLVALGASNLEALRHLRQAINLTGIAGTTYSTGTVAHATVEGFVSSSTTLQVRAKDGGTAGNSIATTETGANIAWGAATLAGGAAETFAEVDVPDGDGIISVDIIAGFILCLVAQDSDTKGRFYWIEPGETTIDPLNFATAERSPDGAHAIKVNGDQFWIFGTNSIEPWALTGDGTSPFLRQQGRLFDPGVWEGTVVCLKGVLRVVGMDGVPYQIGDSPQPIGTPGVTERFRRAIAAQREV